MEKLIVEGGATLRLVDALGRTQLRQPVTAASGDFYEVLPTTGLPDGWYTLEQVEADGRRYQERVLIQGAE